MYIMEYSNAKFYKIYSDIDEDFYIGSTCCSLSTRMAKHRFSAKVATGKNSKLYRKMQDHGNEHFFVVLLDEFRECQNKEQLHKKEREYIDNFKPTLNYVIPTRTYEEWVAENHDHKKELDRQLYQSKGEERIEYQKEYAKNNPEKRRQYKKTCYDKNKEKYLTRAREKIECIHCSKEV